MVAAPHGRPFAGAPGLRYASNAQASHADRPGTNCDEPTRGAPNRCVKQGVPHSTVPPRRKRADGPLGDRRRRPRTYCGPAPSAAAVTLAHERGPPRISSQDRRTADAPPLLAFGRLGLDHLRAAIHGYRDTLTCISEPIGRRPATGDPQQHARIAYRRLGSAGGASAHSGPPVRPYGAALQRRWPGARSPSRGQMGAARLRRRVSERRPAGGSRSAARWSSGRVASPGRRRPKIRCVRQETRPGQQKRVRRDWHNITARRARAGSRSG
jgi:hypothetical protein